MALPSAPVSRQAPRSRPASPVKVQRPEPAPSLENAGLEAVEEPTQVPTVTRPPRLTVNGVAVRHVMIDFGRDCTGFHPAGATIDRYWDQYDDGDSKDHLSRPRVMGAARIEVVTSKGFLDIMVTWPTTGAVTKIQQPTVNMSYEA